MCRLSQDIYYYYTHLEKIILVMSQRLTGIEATTKPYFHRLYDIRLSLLSSLVYLIRGSVC